MNLALPGEDADAWEDVGRRATSVVYGTVVGEQALAPGWPVRRTANEGRRHVGPTFLADVKEMGVAPHGVKLLPRNDRTARACCAGRSHNHISDVERFESVSLIVEGQSICFTKPVQQGLQWCEHRGSQANDWSERHRDGTSCPFRPVGHRQPGDKPPDEMTALAQQQGSRAVEDVERNLEVVRHELPRSNIPPRGVADGAPFCPHAKVANGIQIVVPLTRAVRLDRRRQREGK